MALIYCPGCGQLHDNMLVRCPSERPRVLEGSADVATAEPLSLQGLKARLAEFEMKVQSERKKTRERVAAWRKRKRLAGKL